MILTALRKKKSLLINTVKISLSVKKKLKGELAQCYLSVNVDWAALLLAHGNYLIQPQYQTEETQQ